ncbi:hypothetical protein [Effusibacillus consociatus]|uniref:ABC transporter permease n=1 Tax=Effusibacillus consociatus TaxID=1117041 RepID=A0ABV9PZG6_9BACL
MDKRIKVPSLITDIRAMEWQFWLPVIASIILAIYTYTILGACGSHLSLTDIKLSLGIGAIPLVAFWVIGLYQDLVEADGREVLLSLPYNQFQFGLLRLLRMAVLYVFVIWGLLGILLILANLRISYQDFLFSLLQVMFFASFSFVVILATKNSLISYAIIGVLSSAEYMTRGGITGWVYPFEWPLPKPHVAVMNIVVSLIISIVFCLTLGQWLFNKKEYLVK